MNFSINQIVSSDELSLDVELIKNKLVDTPELIVFDNNQPQFIILSLNHTSNTSEIVQTQKTSFNNEKEKIGKYVQETMRKLCYQNLLSESELLNLTDSEYCVHHFSMNFPILKEYNPNRSFDEQKKDAKGYNRYYSFTLSAYGKQYLLCSQWIEYLHRDKFEKWLSKFELQ